MLKWILLLPKSEFYMFWSEPIQPIKDKEKPMKSLYAQKQIKNGFVFSILCILKVEWLTFKIKPKKTEKLFNLFKMRLFFWKYKQNLHHFQNDMNKPRLVFYIFVTEIIQAYGLRASIFSKAITTEIHGLENKNA